MACPGSINLAAQVPVPLTTDAAEEGTRAHAVAELALRSGRECFDFVSELIEGGEVTEDMALATGFYVDHCREIMSRPGVRYWIERQFSLARLKPPEPMFGTSDFCAYDGAEATLHVVDLKFGAGVLVEVVDSKQLRYYALGALLSLLDEDPSLFVETIVMTIVQPRKQHAEGVVRSWTIGIHDLMAFAAELLAAANATQAPDAPLAAGEHCRFCPASGVCPARRDQAQALAQVEFAVVEPGFAPAPATLPLAQVAAMLPQLDLVEDYIKDCRAAVRAALDAGIDVPGYKLVATRPTRKWLDAAEAENVLVNAGYENDEIFVMELKSPAQIEKLLKKKAFGEKLGNLVVKKSSGTKMVPADDPSPAVVLTRGEEFLALPSGSEE